MKNPRKIIVQKEDLKKMKESGIEFIRTSEATLIAFLPLIVLVVYWARNLLIKTF